MTPFWIALQFLTVLPIELKNNTNDATKWSSYFVLSTGWADYRWHTFYFHLSFG